jgi:hypothetical protein
MRKTSCLMFLITVACGLVLLPAIASAQAPRKGRARKTTKVESTENEPKLPEAVKKTFDDKFPNAKIEKAEGEKEGGVGVWDIEFRDGKARKECDIAEDGTMLEYTLVINKKQVPADAMKAISAAAEGGKMGRTEKIEIMCETKDGKIVKLDKPKMQYAAEMTKGDQSGEIIVDDKGKVVEEPKWHASKPKAEKKSAKSKE